jgi:hypothetical protein
MEDCAGRRAAGSQQTHRHSPGSPKPRTRGRKSLWPVSYHDRPSALSGMRKTAALHVKGPSPSAPSRRVCGLASLVPAMPSSGTQSHLGARVIGGPPRTAPQANCICVTALALCAGEAVAHKCACLHNTEPTRALHLLPLSVNCEFRRQPAAFQPRLSPRRLD